MSVRFRLVSNFAPLFCPTEFQQPFVTNSETAESRAFASLHAKWRLGEGVGRWKVRIPTLPPLILIKALIYQGFFVP